MLLIEKDQEVVLSNEYHERNNLCAVIYDQLTEVLSEPTYSSFRATTFEFSDPTTSLDSIKESNLHILDYLQKNGHNAVLSEVLVKHVTLAILSD